MLSFLTNLRDMKSSLASGMLLLFCLWLVFGNAIADVESDATLAGNLRRLTEYLGSVGTLGIIAFIAYVVGLVSSMDRLGLLLGRNPFDRNAWYRRFGLSTTTWQRLDRHLNLALNKATGEATSEFIVRSIFSSTAMRGHEDLAVLSASSDETKRGLQRLIVEDVDILAVQLHSKHEKIYDKYDKARTEAEFRAALIIPIILLGFVLMWRLLDEGNDVGYYILFLSIGVALLLRKKASHKEHEANEEIVNAIITGEIEFAPLTILKDIAEGTLKENPEPEPNTHTPVPRGPLFGGHGQTS
jgi:hypothetical protein